MNPALPPRYPPDLPECLAAWLPGRRWFRAKARTLRKVTVEAALPLDDGMVFTLVRADFADGEPECYAVPLILLAADRAEELPEGSVLGTASDGCRVADACPDANFRAMLFELLAGRKKFEGAGGILRGRPVAGGFPGVAPGDSRLYAGEQSNTSFAFAERVAVKLYRRVEAGVHPEPEMLRFLRERTSCRHVPAFLSSLEWIPKDGGAPTTLALAQEFVPGARDAWAFAVDASATALNAARADDAAAAPEYAQWAARVGRRVGELHAALASRPEDSDFAPEPLAAEEPDETRAALRARLDAALAGLAFDGRARLETLLTHGENDFTNGAAGMKIRTHGDLHLGQILLAGDDVRILDFEGEPGRPLAEARRKRSPLRDVAGMLRSFHYAAHVAARGATHHGDLADNADTLAETVGAAFLRGYEHALAGSPLLPAAPRARRALLRLYALEKAVYELEYERNNRPDWVEIPLRGLVTLCNGNENSSD